MFSRRIRAATLASLGVSLFWIATCDAPAWGQPPAEPPAPTIEELTAACESAKEAFVPRTDAHLEQAQSELLAAMARLDRMLRISGAGGEGWRTFLAWDQMRDELDRRGGPDLATLDAVYARYASGHNGLGLSEFAGVRRALRRYLSTARAIGNDHLEEHYRTLLDALPKHLRAYADAPAAEEAFVIGEVVRWLEEAGQAPELIEAIRRYFARPNLFVQVSADFVAAGIARPVDRDGSVSEVIRGTRITGTEHTTGEVTVELIPRAEFAEIDVIFRGRIESDTVGRNGPAVVYSESTTGAATRKPIKIDAERVWTEKAQTNAATKTRIKNVQTTRGGGLVAQQARQQVNAQKRQSEIDAARRAETRVSGRLDGEIDPQIDQLAQNYQEKFRKPLLSRDLFPEILRFHTSDEALHATARHGGLSGLGAAGPPPEVEGEHAVVARLHESVFNNLAGAALGGMIVEEDTLRAQLTDLLGETPTWFEPDEEAQPWTIVFAERQPVSIAFADGGFVVTLRGSKYVRGENSYPGMDVTAEYKIDRTDDGVKALRQGDLKIFPPGFTPGGGKRLSPRQQVLRTLLEKRFGTMFTEEIVPEPIGLGGNWENAGELTLSRWEAADGWSVLCWQLTPKPFEKPAEEKPEAPAATAKTP